MEEINFFEVDYSQIFKHKNNVSGDVFISKKTDEGKIITSLADGLGSGIKANVLATLTATMATNFIKNNIDIKKSSEIIIDTLPVCKIRKIGYSAFSVCEIDSLGNTRIIEYDNPSFIYLKGENVSDMEKETINLKKSKYKENHLYSYNFKIEYGDRLIFFSDGVTQSGMGKPGTPLGWENERIKKFAANIIKNNKEISARDLSRIIADYALLNDGNIAHDDITCEVIYCRKPRKLLVVTGPSLKPEKDKEMASLVNDFCGGKIISGGTTAKIIARELKREVEVDMTSFNKEVPPSAKMDGIDLITEGIVTLCKTAEILEKNTVSAEKKPNPAFCVVEYLLNNDIIHFIVGTKINDAHQDPKMPIDIEIRRNIVKRIMRVLEEKYLKKVVLEFL